MKSDLRTAHSNSGSKSQFKSPSSLLNRLHPHRIKRARATRKESPSVRHMQTDNNQQFDKYTKIRHPLCLTLFKQTLSQMTKNKQHIKATCSFYNSLTHATEEGSIGYPRHTLPTAQLTTALPFIPSIHTTLPTILIIDYLCTNPTVKLSFHSLTPLSLTIDHHHPTSV